MCVVKYIAIVTLFLSQIKLQIIPDDDNYVIITFYTIYIKLWIFDSFSQKLLNNQYYDNQITHKIYVVIDYIICFKKKQSLLPKSARQFQLSKNIQSTFRRKGWRWLKRFNFPKTGNWPAFKEKVITHANESTHLQFSRKTFH